MTKYGTTTGIVFRTFNAQEADKIIHMLTEDGSRLALAAKGVRRATSRKAHAIDLLNKVQVKTTSNQELPTITEAKLISQHQQFKTNYSLISFTQFICEVIDLFVQEQEEEKGYYRNLDNLLQLQKPTKLLLLASSLMLRFLYISGHLPKLDQDVTTGEKLNQDMILSTPSPGFTSNPNAGLNQISSRIVKVQKFILQSDFAEIEKLSLSAEDQMQLFNLHLQWIEFSLQVKLKSTEIFLTALQG